MRQQPSPTQGQGHFRARQAGHRAGGTSVGVPRLPRDGRVAAAVRPVVHELLESRTLFTGLSQGNWAVSIMPDRPPSGPINPVAAHVHPSWNGDVISGTSLAAALASIDWTVIDPDDTLTGVSVSVVPASDLGAFGTSAAALDVSPDSYVVVVSWTGSTPTGGSGSSGGSCSMGGTAIFPLDVNQSKPPGPCNCDDQNAAVSGGSSAATQCGCGCGQASNPGTVSGNGPAASNHTPHPVYYADGVVDQSDTDLSSDGFGTAWGVTRDWTNNPEAAGGDLTLSGGTPSFQGVFGNNVVENQLARLVSDGTGSIGIATNGDDTYWFDPAAGGGYAARYAAQGMSLASATVGGSAGFSFTNAHGAVTTFYGFGASVAVPQQGQMAAYTDSSGTVMTATYTATGNAEGLPVGLLTSLTRSYTDDLSHTASETYAYSYADIGSSTWRCSQVQLQQTVGGTTTDVQTVQYWYYGQTNGSLGMLDATAGNAGDLEYANLFDGAGPTYGSYDPSNAAGAVNTDYYRYYTADTFDSDGNGGYQGDLKFVLTGANYARFRTAAATFSTTGYSGHTTLPDFATDAQVAPYADYQYTYDSANRISAETVAGAGGTAAGGADDGGLGTITYAYASSSNTAGPNSWATRTTVTQPDGNAEVVYANIAGETMLDAYVSVPTGGSVGATDAVTATDYQYNDAGQVVQVAAPSAFAAVSGAWYDDADADPAAGYLSTSAGLVESVTYATTTTASGSVAAGTASAGDVAGFVKEVDLRQGTGGTAEPQESWTYKPNVTSAGTAYVTATDTTYGAAGGADGRTTSYAYAFYSGSDRVRQVTVTLPTISAAQDGPDVADVESAAFDPLGNLVWSRDGSGAITYAAYSVATGAMVKSIADVNTADTSDFDSAYLPSGWTTPTGDGLELVTTDTIDDQGRTTKGVSPAGRVTVYTYDDADHEVREYDGWTGTATTGPTVGYREDWSGGTVDTFTISAAPHVTDGLPDGTEAATDLQSLTRTLLDAAGQAVATDSYFSLTGLTLTDSVTSSIPYPINAIGPGTSGTNFNTATYAYDIDGNLDRTADADGTIERAVYDGQGQAVSQWIGTADLSSWSPATATATGNNLVDVEDDYYDGSTTPGDVGGGDGDLTKSVAHPGGGASDRTTTYAYDYKDEPTLEIDGYGSAQPTAIVTAYDNAGEATGVQQYAGSGFAFTGGAVTTGDAALLRADASTAYDDQGRPYQQTVYSVDPTTGAIGTADISSAYYDHRGLTLATVSPTGLATQYAYDGAGWATAEYTGTLSAANWTAAASSSGSVVLSQTAYAYDADGNVTGTTTADRFGTDSTTATGPLGNPSGTGGPAARVSYATTFYDLSDRTVATDDAGTNGGTAPAADYARSVSSATVTGGHTVLSDPGRAGLSSTVGDVVAVLSGTGAGQRATVTADDGSGHLTLSADLAVAPDSTSRYALVSPADLLTQQNYDDAGNVANTVDPRGIVTAYQYDAMGRETRVVADMADGGTSPTDSTNQTTAYAYDGDGNVTSMEAVMPTGEDSQTTDYVYGVSSATAGVLNDADLLQKVEYPSPTTGAASSGQAETYAYDNLGEQLSYTDRDGTAHAYAYDALGRMTTDTVTAFGTGVDASVAQLAYGYNDAGLMDSATSYDGDDGVVNQDTETYDGFGQLAAEAQSESGAVATDGSTPTVGYTYDAANGDRPTGIVYPDGRTLSYGYAAGLDSAASRIASLSDVDGPIQTYAYLGLDTPVTFADGNGTELTYQGTAGSTGGDAGDQYTGLDRFGRVDDQDWVNSSGTAIDEQQYTYDKDSSVLSRRNTVLTAQSELYTYDNLNRLTSFARGTLNSTATGMTGTPTGTESWGLDAVGNWDSDTVDGSATTRTNSDQNQVKTVTTPGGGGDTTATLGYDANGNTTTDQTGQQYAYDAWNRLVTTKDTSGATLVTYGYDAEGRRVTEVRPDTGTGTSSSTTLTYSDRWQVLDERTATTSSEGGGGCGCGCGGSGTTDTAFQYVWSPFYVDDLVARDTVGTASELDGRVGAGGVVTQTSSTGDPVTDGGVAVLPDGDVIVAATDQVTGDLVLFKYGSDGSPDAGFGTGGEQETEVEAGTAVGVAVSGSTLYVALDDGSTLSVAAFSTSSGGLDYSTFGSYGVASASFGAGSAAQTVAVAVDASGRPVVAGTVTPFDEDGATEVAVARFTTAGVLDSTFGTGGEATDAFDGAASGVAAAAIAIGPTGRIAVGGSAASVGTSSASGYALAVFTSGGALDTTFGSTGQVVDATDGGGGAVVTALTFDGSGRLVLGAVNAGDDDATYVMRYTAAGALDATFGSGGVTSWLAGDHGGDYGLAPSAVSVDPSTGKVTVVGAQGGSLAALRFTSSGALDTSFGSGGEVVVGSVSAGPASVAATLTAAGDLVATGAGAAVALLPSVTGVILADRLYAEQDADYNVTSLTDASGAVVERYRYGAYGSVTVLNPDGTVRGDGTATSSRYSWVYLYQGMRLDVLAGTYIAQCRVYDVTLDRWLQEDPAGYIDGPNRYQFELSSPVISSDPSGDVDWKRIGVAIVTAGTGTIIYDYPPTPQTLEQGLLNTVNGGTNLIIDGVTNDNPAIALLEEIGIMNPIPHWNWSAGLAENESPSEYALDTGLSEFGFGMLLPSAVEASIGQAATAAEEIQRLGPLANKTGAAIDRQLNGRGYTKVNGRGGGRVYTKPCPDGNTAAVRVDPAVVRNPPLGQADEVPHVHKEAVPTPKVKNGNYKAPSVKFDDPGNPSTNPRATHIPGGQ